MEYEDEFADGNETETGNEEISEENLEPIIEEIEEELVEEVATVEVFFGKKENKEIVRCHTLSSTFCIFTRELEEL
jgi:hypothetical protein